MTEPGDNGQPWPRPCVSVACFDAEKVLLGQRANQPMAGLWSLPGGHIEAGETTRTAARREVREETGLDVKLLGVADSVDIIHHGTGGVLEAHYVLTVFVAKPLSGTLEAGTDCLDVRWVSLDALHSYPVTDGTRGVIGHAYKMFCGADE